MVGWWGKGRRGRVGRGGGRRGGVRWGGKGLDLKMEADHNWSPETRLQGCAGPLVVDMQQNPQKKHLANIVRLSTSKSPILAKPGPSEGLKPPFELYTPPRKDVC